MVYMMEIYADGDCRRNTHEGNIAAAVAIIVARSGHKKIWQQQLPGNIIRPTEARAQLWAIKLALEVALEKQAELVHDPDMEVKIHTDSIYAWRCMTLWKARWKENGFTARPDGSGQLIDHRDLLIRLYRMQEDLEELVRGGSVEFVLMGRGQNRLAHGEVVDFLNELVRGV